MKLKNRILPGLAALGLIVAIIVAVQAERRPPPAQPVAQPAQAQIGRAHV